MKKLLTSFAVLAFTVSSQAATMTWAISGITQPTSSDAGSAGWLAYLFSTDDTTSSAVSTALANGDFTILGSAFASTETTGGSASKSGLGSFSAGESFTGFAVVLDSNATGTAKNFLVTGNATGKVNSMGSNFRLNTPAASATWAQISVPEPATGALALAGVALLFRRRRA